MTPGNQDISGSDGHLCPWPSLLLWKLGNWRDLGHTEELWSGGNRQELRSHVQQNTTERKSRIFLSGGISDNNKKLRSSPVIPLCYFPTQSHRLAKVTPIAPIPDLVQTPTSMAQLLAPLHLLTGFTEFTLPKAAKNSCYFLLLRCFCLFFSLHQDPGNKTAMLLVNDPGLLTSQGCVDTQARGTCLHFRL